jgi:hypothetical protein
VAFDAFRKSKSLSDTALLLMIASMHRQSVHLVKNPTGYNWLMMEANGVYTMSSLFDELSDSESNRKIAAERLLRETEKQMLPDGMHNELSPDYQFVVFCCAYNFYVQAKAFGFADELPAECRPAFMAGFVQIRKMQEISRFLLTKVYENDTIGEVE